MSKTFYATGNINHNGVAYKRGDVVGDLSDEQSKALLESGAISTSEINDEPGEGDSNIQTDAEKTKARDAKGQDSQESKDADRTPEVGGKASDSGEDSIDSEAGNDNGASDQGSQGDGNDSGDASNKASQYTVLQKFKAEGNKYKVGEVVEMTDEEATQFIAERGEGIIEKVESGDGQDDQSDDKNADTDPSKDL